jgi:serine phosphatase RsbU (regulator of sigma subunit)
MSRLLVIDDEVTFRTAVVYQLEDLGHTVQVASDMQGGIRCFAQALEAQQPFDVVLTDMLMPQTEGLPADCEAGLLIVEGIQKLAKDALILVMTAYGSIENAVKAVRLGAYDYLTKPFGADELQLRLSRALAHQAKELATKQLQRQLEEQQQREQQRLKWELEQAHRIQRHLMPEHAPQIPGISIAGYCQPAAETSGDFYTYFAPSPAQGQIGVALADVSGKGLPGAMIAMMTHGILLQALADGIYGISEMLSQMNAQLFHATESMTFVSLLLLTADIQKRHLQIACAGQWPPVIWRHGERVTIEVAGGMPLGIQLPNSYESTSIQIQPGDIIVCFTDGLIEAENEAEELYGEEGLERVLRRLDGRLTANEILDEIVGNLWAFRGNALAEDDVTIVVMVVDE